MMRYGLRVLPILSLAIAATACGASGSPAAGGRSVSMTSGDAFHMLLGASRRLGAVRPDRSVSFTLLIKDPTGRRERQVLAQMYSPHSASFGRFMSVRQYQDAFGPRPRLVARLRAFLTSLGVSSSWTRGDDWLVVTGAARRIEAAFHVHVQEYTAPDGTHFYASARDPAIPLSLRPYVTGVSHIASYVHPEQDAIRAHGMTPNDLLQAYDIAPLRQHADGSGETVVFFEWDGFQQSDLDTFDSHFGLPPMHPVIADPSVSLKPGGETPMDLEAVHEIAPGAKLIVYNCDGNTNCSTEAQLDAMQQQMLQQHPGAIFSQSWSWCDKAMGRTISQKYVNIYQAGAASGDQVFASTGDSGAYQCLEVANAGTPPTSDYIGSSLPAAAPGVTAVGGTRLSVGVNQSWYDETVWEEPATTNGSGGAPACCIQRPSWQAGPGVNTQIARYDSNNMRMTPDVSADADPASGTATYCSGSDECPGWSQGGGTSLATPIWAGIAALIDQYLRDNHVRPVGAMNPALYALAAGSPPYPPFHDVTVGTNLYYAAGPGYDIATGLGSPDAWNLARDLAKYQKSGHP
ncbi:MAG TPA: S53 family peptidase [Chloroflexota bacterium]|nr:S53 family peptidase [Chloroflexota bacterium]